MNTMTEPRWSTDLTLLCERLAERLASEGAEHPIEAAVALAARGHRGVDQTDFAVDLGLEVDELQRVESGRVAFVDFPLALAAAVLDTGGLDLVRLGVVSS